MTDYSQQVTEFKEGKLSVSTHLPAEVITVECNDRQIPIAVEAIVEELMISTHLEKILERVIRQEVSAEQTGRDISTLVQKAISFLSARLSERQR